jgi:hypothetical protein
VANSVGICAPGTVVGVGAGVAAPGSCGTGPLGSSFGNTVLRVCNGITGCDHVPPDIYGLPADSGGSCGTTHPSVTFTCPPSGFYSVMSGPQTGGGSGVATPGATAGGAYPAAEQDVFPWQEGAFFGNIWGGVAPEIAGWQNHVDKGGNFTAAPVLPLSTDAVFTEMFACSGVPWTQSEAYAEDRVCAGSVGAAVNCAATPKGACSTSMSASPCPSTHVCGVLHSPSGAGDYDECASTASKTWHNPVTVYLHETYDVSLPGGSFGTAGTPTSPLPPACP